MNSESTLICTHELTGPSVWTSADYTDPSQWTTPLSPADIAELFDALAHAKASGKPLGEITKDDFPLNGLRDKLAGVRAELATGRGFAVLSGFPVTDLARADIELMYWGLGSHLGPAVTQNGHGEILVPVRNYGNGGLLNASTRGYQTNSALPFHTDSSDIVGLLCLQSSGAGGLSRLTSSSAIHNELLRSHRELLGLLYAGFYYDRRDEQAAGERPYYRNSVFVWHEGRIFCRYYLRPFVESASKRFGIELTDVHRLALDTFEAVAAMPELSISMTLRPGDIQFLNNNAVVHARTAYVDTDEIERELLRLWLNLVDAPTPPPGFATFREGMPMREKV